MSSTLVLPAAGLATRLGGIPKFLLPNLDGRALIIDHVEAAVGIDRVIVVTRPNLGEFVTSLVEEQSSTPADVLTATTQTMSETVHFGINDLSLDEQIIVGLPDTAVRPAVPYLDLARRLDDSEATIAAYPTRRDQAGRLGAISVEGNLCTEVRDKDSSTTDWTYHWGAIGFRRSTFEAFSFPSDAHVGFALQRAVAAGRRARVAHLGLEYFDLGTVEELSLYFESRR